MINTGPNEREMFMKLCEAHAGLNKMIVVLESLGFKVDEGVFNGCLFHPSSLIGEAMQYLLTYNQFLDREDEDKIFNILFSEEILPENFEEKGMELWKKYRET